MLHAGQLSVSGVCFIIRISSRAINAITMVIAATTAEAVLQLITAAILHSKHLQPTISILKEVCSQHSKIVNWTYANIDVQRCKVRHCIMSFLELKAQSQWSPVCTDLFRALSVSIWPLTKPCSPTLVPMDSPPESTANCHQLSSLMQVWMLAWPTWYIVYKVFAYEKHAEWVSKGIPKMPPVTMLS